MGGWPTNLGQWDSLEGNSGVHGVTSGRGFTFGITKYGNLTTWLLGYRQFIQIYQVTYVGG